MAEIMKSRIEELSLQNNINNNVEPTTLDVAQQEQIRDIAQMVHALKAQFEQIQSQISQATENQRLLEGQVRSLQQRDRASAAALAAVPPSAQNQPGDESPQCHTMSRRRADPAAAAATASGSACCPFCSRPLPDGACPSPPTARSSRDGCGSGERYLSPLLKSFIASLPGPGEAQSDGGHSDSDGHAPPPLPPVAMRKKKGSSSAAALLPRSVSQFDRRRSSSADSDGTSLTSSQSGSSKGKRKSAASHSSGRSPSSADGLSRRAHRYRIVKELTESERNYCSTLRIILEHYQEPLQASGHVSEADCLTIFPPSLQRIHDYHCGILRTLEDRMTTWKNRDVVGDIFAHFTEAHERPGSGAGYREYIENFTTAVATVGRLERTSERFRRTIKGCELQSPAKHGLVSLLMFPVRRIPNYVLMLQQLLKYTEANHPDEFYIPSCLSKFSDILRAMDSSVEQTLHSSSDTASAPSGSSRARPLLHSRSAAACLSSGEELEDDEDHKAASTTTKDSGNYSNNDDAGLGADGVDHPDKQAAAAAASQDSAAPTTLPRSFLKKSSAASLGSGHSTLASKSRVSILDRSRSEVAADGKGAVLTSYGSGGQYQTAVAATAVGATLPRSPAKALLKRSKSQTEVLHQQQQQQQRPAATVTSSTATADERRIAGASLGLGTAPSPRIRRSILLLKTLPSQEGSSGGEQQLDGGRRTTLASVDFEKASTAPAPPFECLGGEAPTPFTESLTAKPSNRGKAYLTFKSSSKDRPSSHSQPDLLTSSNGTLSSPEDLLTSPTDDVQPKKKTFGKSIKSLFSKKRVATPADGSHKEYLAARNAASDGGSMSPPSPASSLREYLDAQYEPPKMFAGDTSSEDGIIDSVDMHDCVDATTHLDLNTYEDENGEPYSAV